MFSYGKRKYSENEVYKPAYNADGAIYDIADNSPSPFDLVAEREEQENSRQESKYDSIDAISSLLSYLLQDHNPLKICARVFLLGYTIRPELIQGKSLAEIGSIIKCSKQYLSKLLEKQDLVIGYRGRNRKPESAKAKQRQAWHKKILANPELYKGNRKISKTPEYWREYQKVYQKAYREKNREKNRAYQKAYRQSQRELIQSL